MSSANDRLQEFVLTAMANDYESLELVLEQVSKWSRDAELKISRNHVIKEIERAIDEGYAKAYVLSSFEPYVREVDLASNDPDELWFRVTLKGRKLVEDLS